MDFTHIMVLKHISALARTLADTVKMMSMWALDKAFWLLGVVPALAEPWKPGPTGSWLVVPSIAVMTYSMLVFKNCPLLPLVLRRGSDGKLHLQEHVNRVGDQQEEADSNDE